MGDLPTATLARDDDASGSLGFAARQGRLLYLHKQNAQLIGRSGGVQFPKHDDVSTGRT